MDNCYAFERGREKKMAHGLNRPRPVCPENTGHVVLGNISHAHPSQILCSITVHLFSQDFLYISLLSCGYPCSLCYFRQSKFMLACWNLSLWSILYPCFWNTASRITDSFRRLSAWVWGWRRGLFIFHLWYNSRKLDVEKKQYRTNSPIRNKLYTIFAAHNFNGLPTNLFFFPHWNSLCYFYYILPIHRFYLFIFFWGLYLANRTLYTNITSILAKGNFVCIFYNKLFQ